MKFVKLLPLVAAIYLVLALTGAVAEDHFVDFRLDSVKSKGDTQICKFLKLPEAEAWYLKSFTAIVNVSLVHRMSLHGCQAIEDDIQDCQQPCDSGDEITIYQWANDARESHVPKDSSFSVGKSTSILFVVLSVHYRMEFTNPDCSGIAFSYSKEPTRRLLTTLKVVPTNLDFPLQPHVSDIRVNWKCSVEKEGLQIHSVYFHGHRYARSLTLFHQRSDKSGQVDKILERSPQRPQNYYSLEKQIRLHKGDELVARCIFNTSGASEEVKFGQQAKEEMCLILAWCVVDSTEYLPNGNVVCSGPASTSPFMPLPKPSRQELAIPTSQFSGELMVIPAEEVEASHTFDILACTAGIFAISSLPTLVSLFCRKWREKHNMYSKLTII